jgi:hypothetical protein
MSADAGSSRNTRAALNATRCCVRAGFVPAVLCLADRFNLLILIMFYLSLLKAVQLLVRLSEQSGAFAFGCPKKAREKGCSGKL